MFDIGWSELLVIGVVALVVIGPKDLPRVLKTVGYWVRKARTVSREFQSSVEQMVREAELDDMKKEIEKVTSVDLKAEFENSIDPTGDLKRSLDAPILPETPTPPVEAPASTPALTEPHAEAPVEAPVSTPAAPVEALPASEPTPKTGTTG